MSAVSIAETGEPGAARPTIRGWLIVAVSLVGISAGPAAFGIASLGLFIGTFEQQFGWGRAEMSAAASLMMLCSAVSMPLVGRLVDRFGARRVLIPSLVILAACMLALTQVTQLWHFMGIYIAMGTVAAGSNSVAYMRVLATWFDRSRGLAIGIAGSGTGFGFAYVPLVGQGAISQFGWQGGYVALGLILLCVALPMVVFLLQEHPGAPTGQDAEAPPAAALGDTLKQAMAKRDFWMLIAIFVVLAFVLYGLIPHMVPLLGDRGMSPEAAAGVASIFGLATFGGRILIGFLLDKFDARHIGLVFFSLSAAGLALLWAPLPAWAMIFPALLLGGSLGAEVDMLAYLASRYFGLKCFAQIFGVLFGAVMIAMGLGPVAFGFVFDLTGSYQVMLAVGAGLCLAASSLVLTLRPYQERRRGAPISVT